MTLKYIVDTVEGLDESVAKLYTQTEQGNYVLDVEGVESVEAVKGLKSAHERSKEERNKAKSELETLQAELEAFKAKQAEEERKALEEKEEFKTLYEQLKEEKESAVSAKEQELNDLLGKMKQRELDNVLISLAATEGLEGYTDVVADLYKKHAVITDDGVKFNLDGAEVDADQVTHELKNKYGQLFRGNGSTGGGLTGANTSPTTSSGAGLQGSLTGSKEERLAYIKAKQAKSRR